MGTGSTQIATGTVASQQDRTISREGAGDGQGIVQRRRVPMFRGQAVVGANHSQAGGGPDFSADVVMAFQPADNEASAMQIQDRRRGPGEDAAGHPGNCTVLSHHAGRISAVEGTTHPVIDSALLCDGKACDIRGIGVFTGLDEGPGCSIDQGCVVHGTSRNTGTMRLCRKLPQVTTLGASFRGLTATLLPGLDWQKGARRTGTRHPRNLEPDIKPTR